MRTPTPWARLPGVHVHHIDATGTWWGVCGRQILRGSGPVHHVVSSFPRLPVDLAARWRVGERLLRADQLLIWPTRLGRLFGLRMGTAWDLTEPGRPRRLFTINGRSPLHGGVTEDPDGNLIFGEYSTNAERAAVRVFRVPPDLSTHEVVHTFEAGSIKHVHTVRVDDHDPDTVWIATGDFEDECYLFAFDRGFTRHVRHGDGGQAWRAVALFFTESHVVWCTDSELEQNVVRRLHRDSGEVETGHTFPAPVYQGVRTQDGLFLCCSTAERGPAVKTELAQLWTSPDAWTWSPALAFPRDHLSGGWFRWGMLTLPTGRWPSDRTWVHGIAVRDLDGLSAAYDLSDRLPRE